MKKSSQGETERSRSPKSSEPFAAWLWAPAAADATPQPLSDGDRDSTRLWADEFNARDCAARELASRIEIARHKANLELCVISESPGCKVSGLDSRQRANVSRHVWDIKTNVRLGTGWHAVCSHCAGMIFSQHEPGRKIGRGTEEMARFMRRLPPFTAG
jgi:hypothetical protein